LDASPEKPDWVEETKLTWEDDGRIFVRSVYTVKGNERLNACFDLAKLDAKESLISEMSNEMKGSVDNAQQSISEDAEVLLGRVISSKFQGRISGLRFLEEYFERYRVGIQERIDCHLLAQISKEDYQKTRQAVIGQQKVEADAKVKDALTQKQADFLKQGN